MKNLEYIKKFTKINLSMICRKTKVDRVNLLQGRTTKENEQKVREEIENQIAHLYIKESEENGN